MDATDEELLMKARNAKNGADFIALYDHGDLIGHDDDHSRADQALCNHLAYWTRRDAERIERLFSASALGQREKWQKRADYRTRTIQEAIDGTTETYSGTMKADTSPYETNEKDERRKTEPAFRPSESFVPYPVLHPDALYGVAGSVVRLITNTSHWRAASPWLILATKLPDVTLLVSTHTSAPAASRSATRRAVDASSLGL